jgi:chemotaxis protein histidine kinase CheA
VIDPALQDLLPLFVTEARRRLERLAELAPSVASAPSAAEARRELHTLKGSSRMLKLRHVAELCHQGETLLQAPGEATPGELTAVLDRLDEILDDLVRGESAKTASAGPAANGGDGDAPPAGGRTLDADGHEPEGEHRISAEVAAELTGSTSAMRLLALAGANSSRRLTELAHLAEEGVTEALPRQVLAMLASHLRQVASDLEAGQHRLLRHAEDQLDRLLGLQLQPLRPFLHNLARHARELARALGKEIEVELEGGEARLDQRIASELRGAFLHLVANAVDHGIESPEARLALGKPRAGRLKIAASSYGERVEIVVADDGAGVDADRVLEAAREAGLVAPEVTGLGDAEVLQLLFTTGFSTRRQVTEVSGRGVGLDAVANVVRQLGGDVWMSSEAGRGSRVFVEVPAARRGETVLIVRCGYERLALPKSSVRAVKGAEPGDLAAGPGGPLAEVGGELLRVVSLAELIGTEEVESPVLVAVQVGLSERVVAVEAIEGEEEVLVRPFARCVPAPELYGGIALLTSGEPVAVLSPRALVSQLLLARPGERPARAAAERLRVLLVEDSLVTREMERRMLEEEGFRVTVTSGAEEALSRLGEEDYDCLVTDLEMPGMDGFELTRHVRSTKRLSQLPIIVVSTRDEAADRMAGLEAGADAYVTKQTLESKKLAGLIRRLGAGP